MFQRRSLKWPITLGVVLIVLVVLLTVGWVLLTVFGAQWPLLVVGASLFALVLSGVVMYLVISIKEINLNRRQTNFMDSVTHELKSPIASLKLYLQTLNIRKIEDEERDKFLQYMLDDVERLDALINHLLVAARLEKSPEDRDIQQIDLAELIPRCAQTVRLLYRVPEEAIQMDLESCIVEARRMDMEVVIRNLIDNAVKYAGEPPQVEVTLSPDPDKMAVVRVSDNGRGIPQKLRRKIFGRFVRLGLELQREKPGTGLGLHIVHTLVTRMKGRVRVKDREDGVGTTFEVKLPTVEPREAILQ